MKANVNAWQEATEAYPDKVEANTEEMKFVAEQEKAPKEDATVKPIGGLRKWHRGQNLSAEHCRKQQSNRPREIVDLGGNWLLPYRSGMGHGTHLQEDSD
jgi:hypothetical protein